MGAYRGALSGVRPDDLAAHAIAAVVERSGVDPERIVDVYFGAANQSGEDNRDVARMAALLAGLPAERPRRDRQPALRLRPRGGQLGRPRGQGRRGRPLPGRRGRVDEPRALGRREARAGPAARAADDARHDPRLADDQPAHGGARRLDRVDGRDRRERRRALRDLPRGPGRLRAAQPPARGRRRRARRLRRGDRRRSRRRRGAARRSSSTPTRGRAPTPRPRSSPKLRPVFREGGTVTAGNASTLNDGAACTLIASEAGGRGARRRAAGPRRLHRRRRRRPRLHGDRPGRGDPEGARRRPASTLEQIDLIEINEAFASQVLACVRELGIDEEKLNVNGGAIALGHPLGCSGARLTTTLVRELRRRGGKYGVATPLRRRRPGPGDGLRSGLAALTGAIRRLAEDVSRAQRLAALGGRRSDRSRPVPPLQRSTPPVRASGGRAAVAGEDVASTDCMPLDAGPGAARPASGRRS